MPSAIIRHTLIADERTGLPASASMVSVSGSGNHYSAGSVESVLSQLDSAIEDNVILKTEDW